MYIIYDLQQEVLQIGLGDSLKTDFARGMYGSLNTTHSSNFECFNVGSLRIVCWQFLSSSSILSRLPDLRLGLRRTHFVTKFFSVLFRLISSKKNTRIRAAFSAHRGKMKNVLFSSLAIVCLGISCSKNSATSEDPVSKTATNTQLTREELLEHLNNKKVAKRIQKNKNRYVFGKFIFVGGRAGMGVLPLGNKNKTQPYILVTEHSRISFLGSAPSNDYRGQTPFRCNSLYLHVLKGTETLAVLPKIEITTHRKFAIFPLEKIPDAGSQLCTYFESELRHVHEEWKDL